MNGDLKRYKRLYKLTGDPAWIAKYAEEADTAKPKLPYNLPTVSQFNVHLVRANEQPFEGNAVQGQLGAIAGRVLADFYDEKLDGDAQAIIDIELKEDLSDGLSGELLS
jgi:hypothetical protein